MRYRSLLVTIAAVVALAAAAHGRDAMDAVRPERSQSATSAAYCNATHNIGRIAMGVSNDGTFGGGLSTTGYDCFTGEPVPYCEYPQGSGTRYLWGGDLWIGAVVGTDTLVSTGVDGWAVPGREWHPDERPMTYRSVLHRDIPGSEEALSEQDYIGTFYDTCHGCYGVSYDEIDHRPHIPLGLEVTQRSFAWSYPYTDDFILLDYAIKNIGPNALSNVYVGVYVDNDVHDERAFGYEGPVDDVTGYRGVVDDPMHPAGCPGTVDLKMAWAADNDGDMNQHVYREVRNVTGLRILKMPDPNAQISYNWWANNGESTALDFGPQKRNTYRDFGDGRTGNPTGDRNKYYVLSNGDIDYDQVYTPSIGHNDPVWLPLQRPETEYYGIGSDTRYCLSCGPFDIAPGESLPLTLAYVGGVGFHQSAGNINNLPDDPDAWYAGVNFDSLTINAIWADWVFDNPGVDSDNDGYAGVFEMCGDEKVWVKGDGAPDFRAASVPAAPPLWVEAIADGFTVRWNGFESETGIDWASRRNDFEGYRAYVSTTGRYGDYVLAASYDIEDYRRYYWDSEIHDWGVAPVPFTLEEAICHHAPNGCEDPLWDPLDYPRAHPYIVPNSDSVFYFEPWGNNACGFDWETPFAKRYPDAPKPPYAEPSDVPPDETALYLTGDGYFKYYEYEYKLKGLVPGQTYWVAVTAFDHGSSLVGSALESSRLSNAASVVPIESFTGCCEGTIGNVDCSFNDTPTAADVLRLIDYLFASQLPLCCDAEADFDGSGLDDPTGEDITMSDLTLMLYYMYYSDVGFPPCRTTP